MIAFDSTVDRLRRRWLAPSVRATDAELLDGFDWTEAELAANLGDIRRVNRFGGGTRAVLRALDELVSSRPIADVAILDLATGSADIPKAIVGWSHRNGRGVRIVASDASVEVLADAALHVKGEPAIELARLDARRTRLPDQSFDVVLCSLALHHFEPAEAVMVLREMDRLARIGCVVNDLIRSRRGHAAAVASSRLLTRNRLTRHDAPLSARRAYTPGELAALLADAGVEGGRIERAPLFRMVAVWRTDGTLVEEAP